MHRALSALALLCVAAAALAATASASTPTDRKVAALAKQVSALQTQVKTLNKQVATLKKDNRTEESVIGAIAILTLCSAAVTADAFAGTWNVVDQIPGGPVKFGPQPLIDDKGACAAFNLTRSQAIPPNVSLFAAIVALGGAPSPFLTFRPAG